MVKPLIRWLTSQASDDDELLYQLPQTVEEIENQSGADHKKLTFKDEASRLIVDDNDASVGAMRDWLREQ